MFNIHRGYRRSSSSDEDTGAGPGSRPPPAQPAPGGGPQRSAGSRPHRVRRALFGRSDPEENIRFVRQELARHRESQSNRWNFDFEHEQPLKGRLDWELVDKQQIHPVYKLSRLPYLRSHDESERENLPENSSNKTGLTGSVDDLKTPPSSTEPPDTVPCSTNLPPGGLPGLPSAGGLPGLPSTSGLPLGSSGVGQPPGLPSSRSVPSSLMNYGAGTSSSSLSSSARDPGGTGFVGLSGHLSSSDRGVGQSSTSRPPDYLQRDQAASSSSRLGSSHYQPASTRSSHSHSSQSKSGETYPTLSSFRPHQSSTLVSDKKPSAPFRVPNPSTRVTTKIQPYVDPSDDGNSQAYGAGARGSDNRQEGVITAPSSDQSVVSDHNDGDNTVGGGARPKTKEQKITDKFRSRKMSRSKSASKLKRLGGGATPSRSPSVKARQQSRSTLPGPR